MPKCPWCEHISELKYQGFCSADCLAAAGHEYEYYLDKFNDYMAGYPVTFEKMRKHPKKETDQ